MPELIGTSAAPRHQLPRQAARFERASAVAPESEDGQRRMYGDRMQIRKTQAIVQPRWGLIAATLLGVALSLGIGVGLGGALVAVGIGLGWLSIALVALIWHELGTAYLVWQATSRQS